MKKRGLKVNKVKYVILSMFTFMVISIYSTNTSYACSCIEPGPVKEELERSSAVFSGKVVGIVDENNSKSIQSSADPIAVLFEVEESWKGLAQTQVIVYTARGSESCGYEFTLNQNYLVYANETDGELGVSYCSRTSPLSTADKDIIELGKGEKPIQQVSIDSDVIEDEDHISSETSSNNEQIYIIFLIVGLLLVFVFLTRRNKK